MKHGATVSKRLLHSTGEEEANGTKIRTASEMRRRPTNEATLLSTGNFVDKTLDNQVTLNGLAD